MSKNYNIEYENHICIITFVKKATRADIEEIIAGFHSEGQPTHRLFDLSVGIVYNTDDIRGVAEYAKVLMNEPAKIAVVAPTGLAFGATRVHTVYRTEDHIDQQVFRDRETALAWLRDEA